MNASLSNPTFFTLNLEKAYHISDYSTWTVCVEVGELCSRVKVLDHRGFEAMTLRDDRTNSFYSEQGAHQSSRDMEGVAAALDSLFLVNLDRPNTPISLLLPYCKVVASIQDLRGKEKEVTEMFRKYKPKELDLRWTPQLQLDLLGQNEIHLHAGSRAYCQAKMGDKSFFKGSYCADIGEGNGYEICRRILIAALQGEQGTRPNTYLTDDIQGTRAKTYLTDEIKRRFKTNSVQEVFEQWQKKTIDLKTYRFLPLAIMSPSDQDDPFVRNIVYRASEAQWALVQSMLKELPPNRTFPLHLSGGLYKSGALRTAIEKKIKSELRVILVDYSPLDHPTVSLVKKQLKEEEKTI